MLRKTATASADDYRDSWALCLHVTRSLRDQAGVIRDRYRIVLDEPHADAVHDLRVALRRLRVWSRMLSRLDANSPFAAQEREIGRLWDRLGSVRDLEVQRSLVDELAGGQERRDKGAFAAIVGELSSRHARARGGLVRSLRSARLRKLIESLTASAEALSSEIDDSVDAAEVAAQAMPLVRRRFKQVRKAGDPLTRKSAADRLHELRLRTKQLRYTAELVDGVEPGRLDELVGVATDLQDVLGELQDWTVVKESLDELSEPGEGPGGGLDGEAREVASQLADAAGEEAKKRRKRFRSEYRRLTRVARRVLKPQ